MKEYNTNEVLDVLDRKINKLIKDIDRENKYDKRSKMIKELKILENARTELLNDLNERE